MPALLLIAFLVVGWFIWAVFKLGFALFKLMLLAGIAIVALAVAVTQALLRSRKPT